MKWMKAVGYGLAYFVIMFLLGYLLKSGIGLNGECLNIVNLLVAIMVLTVLGQLYKIKDLNEGILVGLIWAGIAIALDYLISVLIINRGSLAFYNWSILTSYVLIVFITACIGSRREK
jgi:hypothetical protein